MESMARMIFEEREQSTGFAGDSQFMCELFQVVEFLMAECVMESMKRREKARNLPDQLYYRIACRINSEKNQLGKESVSKGYVGSYMRKRIEKTQDAGGSLRFLSLIQRKELSPFGAFCLLVAVYAAEDHSSGEAFSAVNEAAGEYQATLQTAARLYFGLKHHSSFRYDAISAAMKELKPLLWPAVKGGGWESPVLRADGVLRDYVFGRPWSRELFPAPDFHGEIPERFPVDDIPERLKAAYLENHLRCICVVKGEKNTGRRLAVRSAAAAMGKPLFYLDSRLCHTMDGAAQREYFGRVVRCALIYDGICCIREEKPMAGQWAQEDVSFWLLVEELLVGWDVPVCITCEGALPLRDYLSLPVLEFQMEEPDRQDSGMLWKFFSEKAGFTQEELTEIDFIQLAGQLKLPAGAMEQAADLARDGFLHKGGQSLSSLFMDSGIQVSSGNLERKGKRIPTAFTWDDLVLEQNSLEVLQNACNQIKYTSLVMEDWKLGKKMPYGTGLGILLYGPPGTGKTMTAQIMAGELSLPLYRMDLSRIIDKYIGETEKNIGAIFAEASRSNAILFFDEADALFSKRSQISNSNDRHANTETAYLLQCVEEYTGITILATNYQNNIDEAFKRRMKFVVEFPLPDRKARRQLWEKMFTGEMPVGKIDLDFLAERYELSGGSIKNIVYNSAFLAASEGGMVEMRHILYNLRQEIIKDGALFERSDFGAYEYLFW